MSECSRRDEARWLARSPTVLRISILAFAFLSAATTPSKALDLDEMTVVTMARDGSWGLATAGSQGEAIAGAIRDCKAAPSAPDDCGAQFVTTRGGWVIASLCGEHKIIVAAEAREVAELAALARERHLKRLYAHDMPPCRRILTVNSRGVVVPDQAAFNARN